MLEIGNGHMTDDEYRTHMSLWALTAAPLLAGNDIRTMTSATKEILLNREVIAVDQDTLGKQASQTLRDNDSLGQGARKEPFEPQFYRASK
jgi:alpha-galactosidase